MNSIINWANNEDLALNKQKKNSRLITLNSFVLYGFEKSKLASDWSSNPFVNTLL